MRAEKIRRQASTRTTTGEFALTLTLQGRRQLSQRDVAATCAALGAIWVTTNAATNSLIVELSIKAKNPETAIAEAVARCEAHGPDSELCSVAVGRLAPIDADLVGVAELSQLLHVTTQRASSLARSPGFPAPIAWLRSGPIWHRPTVARYLATWNRLPGRPSVAKRSPQSGKPHRVWQSPGGKLISARSG